MHDFMRDFGDLLLRGEGFGAIVLVTLIGLFFGGVITTIWMIGHVLIQLHQAGVL